jgi:hypothetical protein
MADEALHNRQLQDLQTRCANILSPYAAGEPVTVEFDAPLQYLGDRRVVRFCPSWLVSNRLVSETSCRFDWHMG